ncbi:MAG: hypothetical protein ACRYGK_14565, partial [Janthinobacterium lividum]
ATVAAAPDQASAIGPAHAGAQVESLFIEILDRARPAHQNWFERIFMQQTQPSIFQHQAGKTGPALATALERFKHTVLKDIATGRPVAGATALPSKTMAALRTRLLAQVATAIQTRLAPGNLALVRKALVQALFAETPLFQTGSPHEDHDQPASLAGMLSRLLSAEVSPELAQLVEENLLARLPRAGQAHAGPVLSAAMGTALIELVYCLEADTPPLDEAIKSRFRERLPQAISSHPSIMQLEVRWFALAMQPYCPPERTQDIANLRQAVMTWCAGRQMDESLLESCAAKWLLNGAAEGLGPSSTAQHRLHLEVFRNYLLDQLRALLLTRSGALHPAFDDSGILEPDGFLASMLQPHCRPAQLQQQLVDLLIELLMRNKLTEPEHIDTALEKICSGEFDLQTSLPTLDRLGIGGLAKQLVARGFAIQRLLENTVDWLPSSHLEVLIHDYQVLVPEHRNAVRETLRLEFEADLMACVQKPLCALFRTVDYDTWAREELARVLQQHAPGQVAAPGALQRLLGVLKQQLAGRDFVLQEVLWHRRNNGRILPAHEILQWRGTIEPVETLVKELFPQLGQDAAAKLAQAFMLCKFEQSPERSLLACMPIFSSLGKELNELASNAAKVQDRRFAELRFLLPNSQRHAFPDDSRLQQYEKWSAQQLDKAIKLQSHKLFSHLDGSKFRDALVQNIIRVFFATLRSRDGNGGIWHAEISDPVSAILQQPTRSALNRQAAIAAVISRPYAELGNATITALASNIAAIDVAHVRDESMRADIGVASRDWPPMRTGVNQLLQHWKGLQLRFDDAALVTHLKRRDAMVVMMKKFQGTTLFEPYVTANLPFLRRADLVDLLHEIDAGTLQVAADFKARLTVAKAYFDWMAPALGLALPAQDEESSAAALQQDDLQDDLLKFFVCSVAPDKAVLLRVTDLLALNAASHEQGKVLESFKVIEFAAATSPRQKSSSNDIDLPFLRRATLPAYVSAMLKPNFSIASDVADATLAMLTKALSARAIALSGPRRKLFGDVIHRTIARPANRVDIPIADKKALLDEMRDGTYAILATEISARFRELKKFASAASISCSSAGPDRGADAALAPASGGTASFMARDENENLVKLTLTATQFQQGMSAPLLAAIQTLVQQVQEMFKVGRTRRPAPTARCVSSFCHAVRQALEYRCAGLPLSGRNPHLAQWPAWTGGRGQRRRGAVSPACGLLPVPGTGRWQGNRARPPAGLDAQVARPSAAVDPLLGRDCLQHVCRWTRQRQPGHAFAVSRRLEVCAGRIGWQRDQAAQAGNMLRQSRYDQACAGAFDVGMLRWRHG